MEPQLGHLVERNIGAWMHVEHGLGLYLFANANRRAPTNMHNNAISVNSMHRIRTAQDLALYNLTLSEEIDGFDGAAHIETWNSDPAWQGVRKSLSSSRPSTTGARRSSPRMSSSSPSSVSCSGATSSSTRHRATATSSRLPSSAPASTTTRNATCATPFPMFELLTNDREFADHNKALLDEWLQAGASAISAARTLQPLWSQPDFKPPRFEDGLDRPSPGLAAYRPSSAWGTEGVDTMTTDLKAPVPSPFKADNTASNRCGFTLMNNQVGAVVAKVMETKPNVTVMTSPMIRVDATTMDVVYAEIDEALGEEGAFNANEFEENMSTHYGRMVHEDDRTIMFANPEDAATSSIRPDVEDLRLGQPDQTEPIIPSEEEANVREER